MCSVVAADADDRIAWLIEESDQKAEEARMHDVRLLSVSCCEVWCLSSCFLIACSCCVL